DESDPDEDPEEDPEDPANYLADGGDDEDDDESFDDDDDDAEEDDEDEEEEEHPAPVNSVLPLPIHRVTARMSIREQPPTPFWYQEEIERLLAIPTPTTISTYSTIITTTLDTISTTASITTFTCIISTTTY
ncbi:hypothetical protein Tco_0114482, partial [Tanacetum coccineum]